MGLARPALARTPGLSFWKLLGSGIGEGFTPVPNTAVWAILAVWDSEADAQAAMAGHRVFCRYRSRAERHVTYFLQPTSARGAWSKAAPFAPWGSVEDGPLAALTRASLKPHILPQFWRRVPRISEMVGADPNVLFKIGLGEVPWLHQVTFSIWPSAEHMARFARNGGPHADAIRAVRSGKWFREELYARFRIIDQHGTLAPPEGGAA